ncbi:guanine nucleotide-binding protein subunit alpha [Chytriomyces hyalinus]|nr:guanine nucleotide-binding protein subunit alpha [Chytriomyces hyalinus]
MGSCASSPEEVAAAAHTRELDKQIRAEADLSVKSVKLLLLGAGETGKSTVLKQFKLIYGVGFNEGELKLYRATIILNVITCVKTLVAAMDSLKIPYGFDPSTVDPSLLTREEAIASETPEPNAASRESGMNGKKDPLALVAASLYEDLNKPPEDGEGPRKASAVENAARFIKECDITFCFGSDNVCPVDMADAICLIWKDPGVRYCISRANDLINEYDRILSAEYKPTDQDILSSRIMTTKVTETKFKVQDLIFRVFDLGGQRSERKKWMPYFDDVKAIIFLVAISSYDQVCFEDNSTNRITESMVLFNTVCNHAMFKTTAMILFMNKIDLFREKLSKSPIVDYFPEYNGENSFDRGTEFFASLFTQLNKNPERKIYVHFTWATDTNQIKKILTMVNDVILSMSMSNMGLL